MLALRYASFGGGSTFLLLIAPTRLLRVDRALSSDHTKAWSTRIPDACLSEGIVADTELLLSRGALGPVDEVSEVDHV